MYGNQLAHHIVPLEEAHKHAIPGWKHWYDGPHKKHDWILTDDNYLLFIDKLMPNGDYSLSHTKILTQKRVNYGRGVDGDISYRFYSPSGTRDYKNISFNNRLKILVNSAMLTGDWYLAYRLAYNRIPRKFSTILMELNKGGEQYLVQQLDKLLEENGVSKSFVIEAFKNMAMGLRKDADGNVVDDFRIKDETRAKVLMLFAKWLGMDMQNNVPSQVTYNDNRQIDYGSIVKQLKEFTEIE